MRRYTLKHDRPSLTVSPSRPLPLQLQMSLPTTWLYAATCPEGLPRRKCATQLANRHPATYPATSTRSSCRLPQSSLQISPLALTRLGLPTRKSSRTMVHTTASSWPSVCPLDRGASSRDTSRAYRFCGELTIWGGQVQLLPRAILGPVLHREGLPTSRGSVTVARLGISRDSQKVDVRIVPAAPDASLAEWLSAERKHLRDRGSIPLGRAR